MLNLREGRSEDAEVLAAIHHRSRAAAMPWLPVLHDEAETRSWMREVVLAHQEVLVAERQGSPVGFAALDGSCLEQLYVVPEAFGTGVGRRLLDAAKAERPEALWLYVFARNARARRFYEAAGLVLTGQGDGSGNEEGEPDCTYRWAGISP